MGRVEGPEKERAGSIGTRSGQWTKRNGGSSDHGGTAGATRAGAIVRPMDQRGTGTRGLPPLTVMGWLRFDAIRDAIGRIRPASVVELGCGQGAFAGWLAARASYVGIEPDPVSRGVAEQRVAGISDARIVPTIEDVGTVEVDLACAFEVLEHIEDDVAALAALTAKVRPGGAVLVSVPAHPARFGASDDLVGHFRRYTRPALAGLLDGADLDVERVESYGAGGGQLLDRLQDLLAARRLGVHEGGPATSSVGTAGSGRYRQPGSGAQAVVRAAAAAPLRVVQRPFRKTDIGVGYVALARTRRRGA